MKIQMRRSMKTRFAMYKQMKFSVKDSSVNVTKCDQETADLVTLTEEILNGKLHFLYSVEY